MLKYSPESNIVKRDYGVQLVNFTRHEDLLGKLVIKRYLYIGTFKKVMTVLLLNKIPTLMKMNKNPPQKRCVTEVWMQVY